MVDAIGSNGKMSEVNAAFGLLQLKYVNSEILARKQANQRYLELLGDVKGIRCLQSKEETVWNYSYFPIMVEEEYSLSRDDLHKKLQELNVFARRYFYPLISEFPVYKEFPSAVPSNLPVATKAAEKILCLPMFSSLSKDEQYRIVETIRKSA